MKTHTNNGTGYLALIFLISFALVFGIHYSIDEIVNIRTEAERTRREQCWEAYERMRDTQENRRRIYEHHISILRTELDKRRECPTTNDQ